MAQEIIITIERGGGTTFQVKGVKGMSCKDVTREIEKALGKVANTKLTAEAKAKDNIARQKLR